MAEEKSIDQRTFNIQVGIAIVTILFLLGSAFAYGVWKQGVEDHLNKLEKTQTKNELMINELQSENQELQIELAKINTQLAGIEAHLVDIKTSIREQGTG